MAGVPKFAEAYAEFDPELLKRVQDITDLALEPGALDRKTKLLITLALDTLKGAAEGVRVLAEQARKTGATDEELAEAVRIAYYVAGMDALKTGLSAFQKKENQ